MNNLKYLCVNVTGIVLITTEIICFLICSFLYMVELERVLANFCLGGLCFCYVWPAISSLQAVYFNSQMLWDNAGTNWPIFVKMW
jgi:hypothetical protein